MTDRRSLPVPCASRQTENSDIHYNDHHYIIPPPIATTAIENHTRPNTWPSYFPSTVVKLFLTKPMISLPSFLRQDAWSLSSLSDEEGQDAIEQMGKKSIITSSLHFPAVPSILWHLHGSKNKPMQHLCLPRLDLESPTRSLFAHNNKINGTDIHHRCISPSIKTFHTQSLLFLFGFLFFPCWWYGWYLSSAADRHKNQYSVCCCMNHYQNRYSSDHQSYGKNGSNDTNTCLSPWAYPVVTNIYHDIYCYSRFNRFLSVVSFFFLLIILGLLIWFYWGTIHHWWA